MDDYVQVLVTIDSEDGANTLQSVILEHRAAACVQIIGPISSAYWWEGQIEEAQEWLCVAKTRGSEYQRLESLIKENHPYETPEIIAIPIIAGSEDYLQWIKTETQP